MKKTLYAQRGECMFAGRWEGAVGEGVCKRKVFFLLPGCNGSVDEIALCVGSFGTPYKYRYMDIFAKR